MPAPISHYCWEHRGEGEGVRPGLQAQSWMKEGPQAAEPAVSSTTGQNSGLDPLTGGQEEPNSFQVFTPLPGVGEEESPAPPPMTCPLGPDGGTPGVAGPQRAAHWGCSLPGLQIEFSEPLLPQSPRAGSPSETHPGSNQRKTRASSRWTSALHPAFLLSL